MCYMNNITYFVEECTTITPKEVISIATPTIGKKYRTDIDCWFENEDRNIVSVSVNGKEPQMITLEFIEIHYGQMVYFNCGKCSSRSAKLYLPPQGIEFQCRECGKLKYRLSAINSKSIAGMAIYRAVKINMIMDARATMNRIIYRGQYTHRYNRFLKKCKSVGLHEVVTNAQRLLKTIRI